MTKSRVFPPGNPMPNTAERLSRSWESFNKPAIMSGSLVAVIVMCYCCAVASATLITFPADVAVTGGQSVGSVCGDCCQSGSYCGKNSAGTAMTCMLRARNVFGAIDGGLCVPDTFPLTGSIEDFCQVQKSVRSRNPVVLLLQW